MRESGEKPIITMKTITKFPRKIREIENAWITLTDGCHLAARIWLPEDAEQNPVPAILEYIPYRKRDGTAVRDQLTHPYFAGHGYATVRASAQELETEFVCIPRPLERSTTEDGGPLVYRVVHRTKLWQPGQRPQLEQEVIERNPGLAI